MFRCVFSLDARKATDHHEVCEVLLFHRDAFREISWLVHVAASADGDVVGEELEGDYSEDGK